jgi:hypothetical protein
VPRSKTCCFVALLALVTSVASPRCGRAQSPPERAVRAVVDSFFAFVEREKWDSAAALIDLPRFEPYFKQAVRNARSALPQREMTVEDMMASDSTMPRAVAEWELERQKRYAGARFGDISSEFAGVTTQQALFALALPEAAARWLEAQDARAQLREAWARAGCSLATLPRVLSMFSTHVVLATARGDDSTAFAVHNDGPSFRDPDGMFGTERVMILHRTGRRWRIEPRHDLLRTGQGVSGGFSGCPTKRPGF